MATYGTDLNVFDAADASTNWAELSGHTSGGAPAADTENYFHNSAAVSQTTGQATGTNAGMQCDYGSNITWTNGWVIIAWQYYTAPTNLNGWSSGGMRIGVGSSSGNMYFWNAMGDDFGNAPKECWQNTAIDPNDPSGTTDSHLAADATDGSPTGSIRFFGSLPNVRAKITKGSPHACDVVRYGRGEIYATGTGGTFAGYAGYNDVTTSLGRLGLFEGTRGGYLWKGLLSFGQSGTSLTFSDTDVNIFLEDTPRVKPDFNKMQNLNASTSTTWNGINITGPATSITGSAPVAPGVFDFSTGTTDINGGTFTDLGTWEFNTSSTIDDATYRRVGVITQGGSAFTNCLFDDSSTMVVDDLDEITDCTFKSGGTGHGLDLGTISTNTSITWDNQDSGYAAQGGTAGNRTILVNVTTGNTLTISVNTGASTPTYYNTGSGSVVISASVTFRLTNVVSGTTVYAYNTTDSETLIAAATITTDPWSTSVPANKAFWLHLSKASASPYYVAQHIVGNTGSGVDRRIDQVSDE